MKWIKEIIVDLIVTMTIIIGVFYNNTVLNGIIIAYTGLMLFAKSLVFFGNSFLQLMQKTHTNAPEWVSHILYAINVFILLVFGWWYTGFAWLLIWALSFVTQRKIKKRTV